MRLFKLFYNWWWKKHPPEMVRYFQGDENAHAKARLIMTDEGIKMDIQGEKYPFPGFPRGTVLVKYGGYTALSVLKHRIKNEIFNWAWAELENSQPIEEIIKEAKRRLFEDIYPVMEKSKYDMFPYDKLCVAVRELWRAMTVLEKKYQSENIRKLKEMMCFILQEDDGYRFRSQWIMEWFRPRSMFRSPLKTFATALQWLEHGETVGDMKERQRLFKRIILLLLEDVRIRGLFLELCKEMDWKKFKLSKADWYYFRGKHFKPEIKRFDY